MTKTIVRWALTVVLFLSYSTQGHASLIDDEVTCSFRLQISIADAGGPCSLEQNQGVFGNALVTDSLDGNPEFFLGALVNIISPPAFISAFSVDLGADFIELEYLLGVSRNTGILNLVLGSLDWQSPISSVVTTVIGFEPSEVAVAYGDTSMSINIRTFNSPSTGTVRVQFVPVPGTLVLVLIAGVLFMNGRRWHL